MMLLAALFLSAFFAQHDGASRGSKGRRSDGTEGREDQRHGRLKGRLGASSGGRAKSFPINTSSGMP